MDNSPKRDLPDLIAKTLSVVFHPLLMPVYGLVVIFTAPTFFGYLPFQVKKLLLMIILINNVFLPIALMPFFYHRNIISTWTINDRKERTIPLIITTLLYATSSYIIFRFPVPFFLKSYVFASLFLSVAVTVINLRWKISLHAVGAGALLATIVVLSARMKISLDDYLISAILVSGLVLSSRLRLNYHNPHQVWLGLLTGFLGLVLFLVIF